MGFPTIGFIMLSVFCAGGLFAYIREARRLARLISTGTQARATVTRKEKVEGSESVKHYLVTYEFSDEKGSTVTHQEDLNSIHFFDSLEEGGALDILYVRGTDLSYPMAQVRQDLKISRIICAAIVVVWAIIGALIAYNRA